jgi:hypothetical protein
VITKRRRILVVLNFFDLVHVKGDDMVHAKCKSCGKTYKALGEYGTRNMTRHMEACARKDTHLMLGKCSYLEISEVCQ